MQALRRFRWLALLAVLVVVVPGTAYAALGGAPKPTSVGTVNLDSGLIGWWKLDGNAKDSSVNGRNGTLGTVTPTTDRNGKAGGAYEFSNVAGSGIDTNVSIPLSQFSFSIWIKATSVATGAMTPLSTARDCCGNPYYGFDFETTPSYGGASLSLWNATGVGTSATDASYAINVWTNYVGTYDGSALSLYKNGSLVSSKTVTTNITTQNNSLKIGRMGAVDAGRFKGSIDDVRYYSRALNASEAAVLGKAIASNSQLNVNAGEAGLVAQYKMDGNVKDDSPYVFAATTSGTSVTVDRKNKATGAMNFDGTTGCIYSSSVPTNHPFSSITAGTISSWVRPLGSSSNAQVIARVGANNDERLSLYYDAPQRRLWMETYSGGAWPKVFSNNNVVPVSGWFHAAVTVSTSNVVTFYINGVAAGGGTSTAPTNPANSFSVGSAPACSGQLFKGDLDDLRVYTRALPQSEIQRQVESYNSQVDTGNLQKGLIGYWPFNGNAKDLTPNANNGTVIGGAQLNSDRKARTNSAYTFVDNGSNRIVVGSPATYANLANGFTYSVWIKRTGNSTFQWPQIMGSDDTHIGYGIRTNSYGGAAYFEFGTAPYTGSSFTGLGTQTLPLNTWTLFTVTYTGSQITTYFNGGVTGMATASLNPTFQGLTFTSAGFMPSSLDDARVYNRPLNATEVAQLYREYR